MTTIDQETYSRLVLRSLKGMSAVVLFAMLVKPHLHGEVEIATELHCSRTTVRNALVNLESLGFVNRNGRYEGWILTARARQMVLGEGQNLTIAELEGSGTVEAEGQSLAIAVDAGTEGPDADTETSPLEGREGQNLTLASSSSCTTISSTPPSQSSTTTTTQTAPDFDALDPPSQKAVGYLLQEGVPKRLCLQAVGKAQAQGWDGERVLDCVAGWLDYADTPEGASIKQPGFLTVKRLMACQEAPAIPDKKPTVQDYIADAYERVMKR